MACPELLTASSDVIPTVFGVSGHYFSPHGAMSLDGEYVYFISKNAPLGNGDEVRRWEVSSLTGSTLVVSSDGNPNIWLSWLSMAPDGRCYVIRDDGASEQSIREIDVSGAEAADRIVLSRDISVSAPAYYMESIFAHPEDGMLYMMRRGGGLWQLCRVDPDSATITVIDEETTSSGVQFRPIGRVGASPGMAGTSDGAFWVATVTNGERGYRKYSATGDLLLDVIDPDIDMRWWMPYPVDPTSLVITGRVSGNDSTYVLASDGTLTPLDCEWAPYPPTVVAPDYSVAVSANWWDAWQEMWVMKAPIVNDPDPCPCLLFDIPDGGDTELYYSVLDNSGGTTLGEGNVVDGRIYSHHDWSRIISFDPCDPLETYTIELDNIFLGYMTADADGRIWIDGTMDADPQDPNGTWPRTIRPLDDPLNPDARLITWHSVRGDEQVQGTFYRGVPRWFGVHPADGNFYHWQSWRQPSTIASSFDPNSFNEGRMYRITPSGDETHLFTIGPRPNTDPGLASDYRRWVCTEDGGLWAVLPGGSQLRRYSITDGSYVDYSTKGQLVTFAFWPRPGSNDSVVWVDSSSLWWYSMNASGVVVRVGPCEDMGLLEGDWPPSVYNAPYWSVNQERVIGLIYDDPTWMTWPENIYDFGGTCCDVPPPAWINPGPQSVRVYRRRG